ncbi:putative 3-oxoacyl-(acyl-carrier-protein) reductase [Erysiphe necator]|uniref:Putative 3-oxoacyl-(Acyl-carrier-protein) reductase n=1 Tax=Uncinula necator TaxID=52586 RepID=A0A0B1PC43_UNCNE|nr:putative 3-oxoacyl-(acyl-carrier-protein) reductase [Erysiphe necator]
MPVIKQLAYSFSGQRSKGKVVIITGANSPLGIGRASAYQFAQHGAKAIFICDIDNSCLESHQHEMESLYPPVKVHPRQFDASDKSAVKSVVDDAIKLYGRLDVFFANAGIVGHLKPFTKIDSDEFLKTLKVNVISVHLAAKYAAPAMMITSEEKKISSGSIICTASVAGLRSNAGPSDYSASKAGVISLAQTLAYQLSGTRIRVNAICPGLIETGMTASMFEAARAKGNEDKVGQLNPLRRGAHADEVARVAIFLGSDESSYVNGQAWAVDGGLSAGHPFIPGKLA